MVVLIVDFKLEREEEKEDEEECMDTGLAV